MLNEQIKKLRTAQGISQVELAKKLGVTKQSISNWENNNIQPSVDMLVRLAHYFSVSTDFLLDIDHRKYLEITGLTDAEISHISQIIQDIRGNRTAPGKPVK